ncbi:GLPGLI family protein [Dyadobacter aurulentus]|uniref:GLPGLI family protein n=1 Tax=Dyadobacter sp. UC 10 TaxID=2605428 RepID=UPI0011F277E1|nr:GLPGLI family protein [Dyadobacter sp. UC 10]KAA0992019.1 GLPGLI family protein [Dyadobacter sp. UC 10]
MKKLLAIFLLISALPALAQSDGVAVTYERTFFWSKVYEKLTFLSEEEKSRMKNSWGVHDEGWKVKGQLFATASQSKYAELEQEADGGYRGRKSEYLVFRDFDKGRKLEAEEFAGKLLIIDDSLAAPKWKIMNKIKEISGYMCMMAVSEDTVKGQKITAWFANDLAYGAGPERYYGLPGLILEVEVNDGEMTLTAIKVEKKPLGEELALPKKMKGKKITTSEYEKMMATHFRDSIKSRRNPYWAVRY